MALAATHARSYRVDMATQTRRFVAAAAALFAVAGELGAQTVRGTVTLPDSSRAAGVIVLATDAGGATAARALTGEAGGYEFRLPAAGRYEVRVLRIGFSPTILLPFDIAAGESRIAPASSFAARPSCSPRSRCRA